MEEFEKQRILEFLDSKREETRKEYELKSKENDDYYYGKKSGIIGFINELEDYIIQDVFKKEKDTLF